MNFHNRKRFKIKHQVFFSAVLVPRRAAPPPGETPATYLGGPSTAPQFLVFFFVVFPFGWSAATRLEPCGPSRSGQGRSWRKWEELLAKSVVAKLSRPKRDCRQWLAKNNHAIFNMTSQRKAKEKATVIDQVLLRRSLDCECNKWTVLRGTSRLESAFLGKFVGWKGVDEAERFS